MYTALIILLSTFIGAITGLGGGIIIKPLLSIVTDFSVIATNFYAALAIFSMTLYSLYDSKKNKVEIDYSLATILSIGALIGGVVGSGLVIKLSKVLGDVKLLNIQLILLIVVMVVSIIITLRTIETKKHKVPIIASLATGLFAGLISAFLGIGGGIVNIPILILIYKEAHKQAVLTSLFVVFISQLSSIVTYSISGYLSELTISYAILICICGILGGIAGKEVFRKLSSNVVKMTYVTTLLAIIVVNLFKIF